MKHIRKIVLPALLVMTGSTYAIEAIPEQPGWAGFVTVGVGGLKAQTNMIAGIDKY